MSRGGISIYPPVPDMANGLPRYTSAQRPQQPYVGMLIYETDTFRIMQYQSATTGWTPPWNEAWGDIGEASITADASSITGTATVPGLSLTFTAVKNRRLLIEVGCYFGTQTGAGQSILQIWNGTTTALQAFTASSAAGNSPGCFTSYRDAVASAGSLTYTGRVFSSATGFVVHAAPSGPAFIRVRDIGPSGVPA